MKKDREKFLSSIYVIIKNEDNKILLQRRQGTKLWHGYLVLTAWHLDIRENVYDILVREVKEELDIDAEIVRPLWLNQSFFTEDVSKEKYHELCLYFLVDITKTDLISRGTIFTIRERHHTHEFEWIELERLKDEYFYPTFLKDRIFELPETLTIYTELRWVIGGTEGCK